MNFSIEKTIFFLNYTTTTTTTTATTTTTTIKTTATTSATTIETPKTTTTTPKYQNNCEIKKLKIKKKMSFSNEKIFFLNYIVR